MKATPLSLCACVALVLHLFVVPAEASKKDPKLSDWKIGKVLFGERISKADMKGKVVVIENWGVHCPPCIAALPHLAELDRKYRDKGLILIGAESQGSSKSEIKPLIEKAKVEFTIVDDAEGPLEVTSIPRAFVFDREGKMVYDGNPGGQAFEQAITSALGVAGDDAAPAETAGTTEETKPAAGPMIASRTWTNSEGREIRAAVKSCNDREVVFLMDGGREVKYPLANLSEESRKVIEDAAADTD